MSLPARVCPRESARASHDRCNAAVQGPYRRGLRRGLLQLGLEVLNGGQRLVVLGAQRLHLGLDLLHGVGSEGEGGEQGIQRVGLSTGDGQGGETDAAASLAPSRPLIKCVCALARRGRKGD